MCPPIWPNLVVLSGALGDISNSGWIAYVLSTKIAKVKLGDYDVTLAALILMSKAGYDPRAVKFYLEERMENVQRDLERMGKVARTSGTAIERQLQSMVSIYFSAGKSGFTDDFRVLLRNMQRKEIF